MHLALVFNVFIAVAVMVIACSRRGLWPSCDTKGAVTSKIKHAIKLKTSPARLAQLLQPSSAFCFSLQAAAKNKKANMGCNSCASLAGLVLCFIACFILLVIAP